ncbi:Hsp20/alpha crystallin family protein [Agromyces tropicus]|uniref:Hsp20/alpha crystallin family protein n=1 Tax=Agromyces tropicus TaxID=555371 RepID=A0ABN2UEW5_9MICO
MAMTWDPFRDLDRLAASLVDTRQGPRMMPIDLHRDGDHYVLSADLPGVDPGSIDIDVDGQLLTIRAERTLRNDDVQWLAHERPSGSFLRQLTVGDGIDTAGISAHYDNGVLSVIIPVSERAKPRKVEVRSSTEEPKEVASGS